MKINKTLNKAEATEFFESEAILMGSDNAIPFYRAVELFGEWAAYQMPDCLGGIAGREYHHGGSIDFQVTELREWAAEWPAALSHMIERRCLLWQDWEPEQGDVQTAHWKSVLR